MNLGFLGYVTVFSFIAFSCSTHSDEDKAKAFAQGEAKAKADIAAQAEVMARALIEKQASQEKAKAEQAAKEKEALVSNPSAFLEASGIQYVDEGIINDYRQLTNVTIFNRSKFAVSDLQGMTDWIDENGNLLGSTPVTLIGSITPGESRSFAAYQQTLSSGTLQAKASHAKIRITHVILPAS